MIEVFHRDPPNKSHIVAEQPDDSTVVTECGMTFEQKGFPITTFEYHPDKEAHERMYHLPAPEGRCGNCPWEEELDR